MKPLDEKLQEYATPRQWELLRAAMKAGSDKAAGREMGIDPNNFYQARRAVLAKAAQHGYAPDHDFVNPLPEGFKVGKITTLRDMQTGEAKIQWQQAVPDKEQQAAAFKAAIEAMTQDVPRFKPAKAPKITRDDLLACYPIGDHHLGMLAWDKETGADYDINIAEKLLNDAMDYLVGSNPNCSQAVVAVLGDFMHYDSFKPMTPTSGNLLDADSRFPKMVGAAIRLLRRTIERALAKHAKVHVIIEIGNHDLSSSIFLQHLLANVYENEPRITVDISPKHFHFYQFGKNMIMTHHGHGVKPKDLPIVMATDQKEMWGTTEHRVIWSGHVHHDQAKDLVGASFESFAVLAPEDAYAAQKGYRSRRAMQSIVLHREFGEVDRHTVNPEMLK